MSLFWGKDLDFQKHRGCYKNVDGHTLLTLKDFWDNNINKKVKIGR